MRSFNGNRRRHALWAALALSYGTLLVPAAAQEAGFGKDIPLNLAVKQIVPDGYTVQMGQGVDADAKVSWNGGGWKQALASATKGAGYAVTVTDTTVKVVRSGARVETAVSSGEPEASASRGRREVSDEAPRPSRAERQRRVAEERAARRERWPEHRARRVVRERVAVREHVAVREETVPGGGFVMLPVRGAEPRLARDPRGPAKGAWREARAVAPPVAEPAPAGLVVREGENLQEVLREWSAKNGWRLVWNSEFSYRLTASARFGGDFVSSTSELLKSLRHVRPIVTASFYNGNRTIVVGNDSADAAGQ